MIITQTPLRLSFLGGNTDFPDFYTKFGGAVLTTAIDKYVFATVTKRFDDLIRVSWSKLESVEKVADIEHELVRESLKKVGISKAIEIKFLSDIPSEGSGLGSSSSVLVGTLNALYHFTSETPTAQQLAREACEIEIDILKKPIGIQDQYIAAFGGLRFIEFHQNGQVTVERLPINDGILDDLDNSLMLFYTGQSRSSGSILKTVKTSLSASEKILLRNKELAFLGKKYLLAGKVKELGRLMHEYWLLKKSLNSNISNEIINDMYQRAIKAGAIGGKIAGAGGGGFLLLMVPSSKRARVRRALTRFRELPFHLERDGSKVIFNVRRY